MVSLGYALALFIALVIFNQCTDNFIARFTAKEDKAYKVVVLWFGHFYSAIFCIFIGMICLRVLDDFLSVERSLLSVIIISIASFIMTIIVKKNNFNPFKKTVFSEDLS